MLSIFSTALSGASAATIRLEAVASNIANADSNGALPSNAMPGLQQVYQPLRVEQSSLGGASGPAGTTATLRSTTPAYLAVYDPSASYADQNGLVAAPNVDPVKEITDMIDASAAFTANLKTVDAASDLVKRLYDLSA
jgi:flagellar basal-body rod protein FlgC